MKTKIVLFALALLLYIQAGAQITEAQYQKIDSLFIDWNRPNHPGGTVGLMIDGKIVFSKAYGLASLEYLVPNSTETIFNIASVSKQFTAMGIVRLQEQGQLSVDDDIRKYLPDLPDFGEKITIRHLLHHTSGLRSLHALLELAGWREDDSRFNEDLDRFMKKQQALNFKPNDRQLYCNTGYIFMANIIEKISGEPFPTWMKENIFEPLGLIHTYVEDEYDRVVVNNATSYYRQDQGFARAVEFWGYVGSGNMHATTNDLLRWLNNFINPQAGWESAFKTLKTVDPLNSGEVNNYAFGVVVDEVQGSQRISHNGAIGGFRSHAASYTDEKLNLVVLTNFSNSSPNRKAREIVNLLLKKGNTNHAVSPRPSIKAITLSQAELKKFEASYWNDESYYARKIYLKEDTLRYFRSENNESPLVPIGKNAFQMWGVNGDVKVRFDFDNQTMAVQINDGNDIMHTLFDPSPPTAEDLKTYTGTYYSPELEVTYNIFIADEKLKWHHPHFGDHDIKILKKDILQGAWPLDIIRIERNPNQEIKGLFVSNGRVLNLWFEKINPQFNPQIVNK